MSGADRVPSRKQVRVKERKDIFETEMGIFVGKTEKN